MEVAAEVGSSAPEAAESAWMCANPSCRSTTFSKKRGPNREFCSRSQCKQLASKACAVAKENDKDAKIAELEAKVLEQATQIALLRSQLAASQRACDAITQETAKKSAAAKPAADAAKPAAAGVRRPLGEVSLNAQPLAPAKKPKLAAASTHMPPPAASALEYKRSEPPAGWTFTKSEFEEDHGWSHPDLGKIQLQALVQFPSVVGPDDKFRVDDCLLWLLMEEFIARHGRVCTSSELRVAFESILELPDGTVRGVDDLRRAYKKACAEATNLLNDSVARECDDVLDVLGTVGADSAKAAVSARSVADELCLSELKVLYHLSILKKSGSVRAVGDESQAMWYRYKK